jgi:hypothetical protein
VDLTLVRIGAFQLTEADANANVSIAGVQDADTDSQSGTSTTSGFGPLANALTRTVSVTHMGWNAQAYGQSVTTSWLIGTNTKPSLAAIANLDSWARITPPNPIVVIPPNIAYAESKGDVEAREVYYIDAALHPNIGPDNVLDGDVDFNVNGIVIGAFRAKLHRNIDLIASYDFSDSVWKITGTKGIGKPPVDDEIEGTSLLTL